MLMRMMPLDVMVPTTGGLTLTLPASGLTEKAHNPFGQVITISGIKDEVVIMSSLQRPKKVWCPPENILCLPTSQQPCHGTRVNIDMPASIHSCTQVHFNREHGLPQISAAEASGRGRPLATCCVLALPAILLCASRTEGVFSISLNSPILAIESDVELGSCCAQITLIGSDGRQYTFLAKPKDDLRKDHRMMEVAGVINRLFAREPSSRRRNLYLRRHAAQDPPLYCTLLDQPSRVSVPRLHGS